jgi:Holliday junction resolvasome RuvABC endonuclease subunit
VGPYLTQFEAWFDRKLDIVNPELVIFEGPVLGHSATVQVTRKLHALPGVVEMVCFKRHVQVAEAPPATIKKTLTGHGRADKDEMMEAARAYGLEITCSDEADAFGAWLAAVRRRRPQFADRWDALRLGAHA